MHVTSCIRCWYMCTSGCLSWQQQACWDSKGNPLHGQHAHTVAHKSAYNSQAMSHANAQHTSERAHPSNHPACSRPNATGAAAVACRCSCMQEASTSSGLAHDAPMIHTRHTRHQRMVPWDTLPTQHTSSTTHTPVDAATQNADAERHKQTQTPPAGAVTNPGQPRPLPCHQLCTVYWQDKQLPSSMLQAYARSGQSAQSAEAPRPTD